MAKHVLFFCGWKSTQRKSFSRLHEIGEIYHSYRSNEDRLAATSLSLVSPFSSVLNHWDHHREQIANGKLHVSHMLRLLSELHVTEPRDRIFALLGMCSKLDQEILKIDYRVSLRWLLMKLSKYELINQEFFQPLTLLQTTRSKKNPMHPSWVPNYLDTEEKDELTMPWSKEKVYNAGGDNAIWTARRLPALEPFMIPHFNSITVQIEDEGSFETLVLTGILVDCIQAAFRSPWVKCTKVSTLKRIEESRKSGERQLFKHA